MPGVPSGRGCDACRKQKKKCDQSKPACSRCTRLKIPCIGCGEQRYKFKNQTPPKLTTSQSESPPSQKTITFQNSTALVQIPDSRTISLAKNLVSQLGVIDIRYDLSCYGSFLEEIPKRLGRNQALDAAVNAFTTCSSCVYTRRASVEAIRSYVHGLKSLRMALNDSAIAKSPDTLCAIYLIMVCQGWMGNPYDQPTSHGEGIAHILKTATSQHWRENFEIEMMLALCIPVLVESVCNPKIQIGTWFYHLLDAYAPPKKQGCEEPQDILDARGNTPIKSLKFRNLAKVTEYINNPESHQDDMIKIYEQMKLDSRRLRQVVEGIAGSGDDPTFPRPGPGVNLHREVRDFSTAYGILLTLMMALNGILHAMDPDNISLNDDAIVIGASIIQLAREASRYRPLGASYVPLCLTVAWAAIEEPSKKAEVEMLIAEYQTDFSTTRWMDMAVWWKTKFDIHRRNQLLLSPKSMFFDSTYSTEIATPPKELGDACCIM